MLFPLYKKTLLHSISKFQKHLEAYDLVAIQHTIDSLNTLDKFKEELFKEEYLNYRHLKLLPKHNLSLTFNEEKKFVLNFIQC
jgi:hypothetical protein